MYCSAYEVTHTGLQPSLYEGLRPMVPFVILCAVSLLWAILSRTDVIDADPRAFIWLNGTIFSNIAVCYFLSIRRSFGVHSFVIAVSSDRGANDSDARTGV